MKKVITYGTYDLLHHGHIRLLERAKALGDYLIVGVTADAFDRNRGKINVQQSLAERMEAVRATGIADEIIIEEYEGQKIDDIRRLGVDIFTVGSDWEGYFDYLNAYCQVIYLERTQGVSSSEIRTERNLLRLGLVGDTEFIHKVIGESRFVNGVTISGVYSSCEELFAGLELPDGKVCRSYDELLQSCDAVYIDSFPQQHYSQIRQALEAGKHVLCESPIALTQAAVEELYELAARDGVILIDALRTAYATAFARLSLLVKSGKIGDVVSIDTTCTSLRSFENDDHDMESGYWNSITAWGPTAMLPIFELLGTNFKQKEIISHISNTEYLYDSFSKISFTYENAVATAKVGNGVKSEGEMIISGTKGYIYVPAPWWKTDYFEIRYENPSDNKRYFYQLEGEGIRYELVSFLKAVETNDVRRGSYINPKISSAVGAVMEDFFSNNVIRI